MPGPFDPFAKEEGRLASILMLGAPIPDCTERCLYGICHGSPWPGCGGCCGCLGGCQVEYENGLCAPFLWEGDFG
jgi:hypothetical protein